MCAPHAFEVSSEMQVSFERDNYWTMFNLYSHRHCTSDDLSISTYIQIVQLRFGGTYGHMDFTPPCPPFFNRDLDSSITKQEVVGGASWKDQ